jgi:hypothetical protein
MSVASKCPFHELRPELEALPTRMRSLPVDERGYVVPWFVDWENGKPEFRAMDPEKWVQAVRFKKCWVCGERLRRLMTFVAGPMCGINRTSSEPPCHLECAIWSARNCPFLSNPEAVRRTDETIHNDLPCIGGMGLKRNPGVTMLWSTKDYSIFDDGKGGRLIQMGEPEHVEWYANGKIASREQVQASIDSGLPALVTMAKQQDGAMKFLEECVLGFKKFLPSSAVQIQTKEHN